LLKGESDDALLNNPKNASGFYFSGQAQDLNQRQGKDGWTKPTHTWGHPLKGTLSREKTIPKQEKEFFLF